MVIPALILLNIASVLLCQSLAKSKGANPIHWGILGAIFGPLAIPFVFLIRPSQTVVANPDSFGKPQ